MTGFRALVPLYPRIVLFLCNNPSCTCIVRKVSRCNAHASQFPTNVISAMISMYVSDVSLRNYGFLCASVQSSLDKWPLKVVWSCGRLTRGVNYQIAHLSYI